MGGPNLTTSHGWTASLENSRSGGLGGPSAALWMVHSGGFYTVEKQKVLRVAPGQVHWFRWEAAMTWLSGMVLMFLVYYFSSGFIDPDVADISQAARYRHRIGRAGFRLAHLRS